MFHHYKKPLFCFLSSFFFIISFQNCGNLDDETQAVLASEGIASEDFTSSSNVKESCLDLVWSPSANEIATDEERSGDGAHRISYEKAGPKGKPSVVAKAQSGEPAALWALRYKIDDAMSSKPTFARIKTTMFIPKSHGFNIGKAKMPLGIWGGDPTANSSNGGVCSTAGCPPSRQNGFSVRLTRHMMSEENYDHGPRLYSYHLNRNGVKKTRNSVDYEYGEGIPMFEKFPLGRWFQLVIDIRLNSFRDGEPKKNGSVDLYMYNMNGKLIGEVHKDGLIFRKDRSWHIFGPLLSDLWGVPYKAESHLPTKTFKTYYRGYKMYFLKEGVSPSECNL